MYQYIKSLNKATYWFDNVCSVKYDIPRDNKYAEVQQIINRCIKEEWSIREYVIKEYAKYFPNTKISIDELKLIRLFIGKRIHNLYGYTWKQIVEKFPYWTLEYMYIMTLTYKEKK